MKYLIENITYKNGTTRTDGKYLDRIGSIVTLYTDVIVVANISNPVKVFVYKLVNKLHTG